LNSRFFGKIKTNKCTVFSNIEKEVEVMRMTTKKLELLEAMLAHPKMSDVKLGELLELNNKTVGKWRKEPEFQEELKRRLKEQWSDAERLAQKKMIELADEGCFQANKYILDSLGYAPAQKIEADISTDINIVIEE
jgi:hypothetical protein